LSAGDGRAGLRIVHHEPIEGVGQAAGGGGEPPSTWSDCASARRHCRAPRRGDDCATRTRPLAVCLKGAGQVMRVEHRDRRRTRDASPFEELCHLRSVLEELVEPLLVSPLIDHDELAISSDDAVPELTQCLP
jgi:hypothetical protein